MNHSNASEPIKQVDENTFLVTSHTLTTEENVQNFRQIGEVEELRLHIRQLEEERNQSIER